MYLQVSVHGITESDSICVECYFDRAQNLQLDLPGGSSSKVQNNGPCLFFH